MTEKELQQILASMAAGATHDEETVDKVQNYLRLGMWVEKYKQRIWEALAEADAVLDTYPISADMPCDTADGRHRIIGKQCGHPLDPPEYVSFCDVCGFEPRE